MASGNQKVKTPAGWNKTQGAWVKTGPNNWKAVDQIYIKTPTGWNNASGQELTQVPYPYIANAQEPNIRSAQQPYPYIANAQEPNIRNAQQPYPYIANAQEPNIRNAQQPYPYIANAQEPNIRNAQQPYPYIANAQEPNIRQARQPNTYSHRSPFTYDYRSPSTYQAIARSPFTYDYRSPYTYQNPVSAQEPNIRSKQVPFTYPANAQEPNIRDARQPFTYPANIQQPNIRNAQQPFTYPANIQQPNIRNARQPFTYPANIQQPNIRSAQQPFTYIANLQQPNTGAFQNPFTFQARQPVFFPGGGRGGGCFAEDTMIWMEDGSYMPIQKVEVGDMVMTADENLTIMVGEVEELMVPRECELYEISFGGRGIRLTGGHPIKVDGKGWCVINMEDWEQEVAEGTAWGGEISGVVEEGDKIIDTISCILQNTPKHAVDCIEKLEGLHKVYHLTKVSGNQNYFAHDILAHNRQQK